MILSVSMQYFGHETPNMLRQRWLVKSCQKLIHIGVVNFSQMNQCIFSLFPYMLYGLITFSIYSQSFVELKSEKCDKKLCWHASTHKIKQMSFFLSNLSCWYVVSDESSLVLVAQFLEMLELLNNFGSIRNASSFCLSSILS